MASSTLNPKVSRVQIPAPIEGINLTVSVDKLKKTEAAQLKGFEFDEYGVIGVPRAPRDLGVIVAGTRVLAGGIFDRGTSALPVLFVHLDDGTIRYSTDWISTSGTATWTTLVSVQGTVPATFVQFIGFMWILVFNVNLHRVDSSLVLTSFASAPHGFTMCVWRDTMWQGNILGSVDRVVSSAPGDPTTWPALNFVDVGKGEEGAGIFGIWPTDTALAIFKRNRSYILFDPAEFTNRLLDPSQGLASRDSLVLHRGRTYFLSESGICRYLGDGPSVIVSQKLQPIFDSVADRQFNQSLAERLYIPNREAGNAYSFSDHVGFHLPTNVTSPYVKYYPDLPEEPWVFGVPASTPSPDRQVRFVTFREVSSSGGSIEFASDELYELSGNPAHLFRHYDQTATTLTIAAEWDTSWQDFGDPMSEKWLYMIQILHRGPIDVLVRSDFDRDNPITIATALDHGETELQQSTIYCDAYGRSFQISVRNASAGERRQQMASGTTNIAEVSRFQAGVAGMTIHAQQLSAYRR